MQDLHIWANQYKEGREQVSALLRNTSDLGERALLGTDKLDAVNDCFVNALKLQAEERRSSGNMAAEQIHKVAVQNAAIEDAIESGRDRIIGALTRGLDAAQRQGETETVYRRQLDECAVFISQAANTAAQSRDSIRSRLQAESAELADVGAGIDDARDGVEGAMMHNTQAQDVIERAEQHLAVSQKTIFAY